MALGNIQVCILEHLQPKFARFGEQELCCNGIDQVLMPSTQPQVVQMADLREIPSDTLASAAFSFHLAS